MALPLPRRSLAAATWALAGAIIVVAAYVLIRLMINGAPLFLAGRLNGPINYRNATALLFALPVWPAVIAASTGVSTWRRALSPSERRPSVSGWRS